MINGRAGGLATVSNLTYAQLRAVDPARWRATAASWRELAESVGLVCTELGSHADRLRHVWSGTAASTAGLWFQRLRRRVVLARLVCWEADQALYELAAALSRARTLLDEAVAAADRAGLVIDADGTMRAGFVLAPTAREAAARQSVVALQVALTTAAHADAAAAHRLHELTAVAEALAFADSSTVWVNMTTPACGTSPADVRRWWGALDGARQLWLVATQPETIGSLDGVPAAYRDLANRLLLDERRAQLARRVFDGAASKPQQPQQPQRSDLAALTALNALADRLAHGAEQRAYLLRLDVTDDGRAVVAMGDPDRADNVLTHVPGMAADLTTLAGELDRAARVSVRAEQLAPQEATSAVLWLDYDSPDHLGEAAGAARAEVGADALHRFQGGLRATHLGAPAHQTVLGHSYGSLVVGIAARGDLAADSVVFVGSPGVGVDSVRQLRVPPEQVWSTTSGSDIIQYTALAPGGLLRDMVTAAAAPGIGAALAFGLPEDELWHGSNPSDRGFGARVFTSQLDAGHSGYWEPGRPALDNLARVALGEPYQAQVR